jgi:hypothetical protein
VWGEDLSVPCFGGDQGDCEAADCVQLPADPLPEDCEVSTMPAMQVCGPDEVSPWWPGSYSVADACACDAEWRPAGCLASLTDHALVFEPRVARCSECTGDAVCVARETECAVYEPPPDRVSLEFTSASEPIAFEVRVGDDDGQIVCQP